uniref:Uncharacterized protein n=1 Tax=Ditylenchus dipsaci TaxID=166011 RepID=A0A915D3T2_9BILA
MENGRSPHFLQPTETNDCQSALCFIRVLAADPLQIHLYLLPLCVPLRRTSAISDIIYNLFQRKSTTSLKAIHRSLEHFDSLTLVPPDKCFFHLLMLAGCQSRTAGFTPPSIAPRTCFWIKCR